MAGRAGQRVAGNGAASGDGAPAPQSGTRWRISLLRRSRRAAAPALGAGIVAAVLAGAMMAAGPAAASPAASSTPSSGAAARVTHPATRLLIPWARARATGSGSMTAQARLAAPAASLAFSGAVLDGVSCTGRSQCTATGTVTTRTGKNLKPLAERWNGTSWTVQTTPTTNTGGWLGGTLDGGVSCTSSTACMAAGYSYSNSFARMLGEGWNGHTWTIQPDSKPATGGQPFGISCRWAKDCTAVGQRLTGMTLAEHWNGRQWSAQTTKHLGLLQGVSCPATGNCTAVGSNNAGKALAAHWNGKSWSDQSVASPQQLSLLGNVSCTAVKDCVAVGTAGTMSGSALSLAPLAEQWTGGSWTVLSPANPAPAGGISELNSVSCTSATNCVAVGDYMDQAGTSDVTVAEQWNGTTWTVLTTPSPATFSALLSVSCPSAAHCVAVG
ncbi:MAG: hypothetical protein JWL68_5530, partial [Actinomycetia bacterium]|nr:hypothetical protein [Actinomycetes bacterium]